MPPCRLRRQLHEHSVEQLDRAHRVELVWLAAEQSIELLMGPYHGDASSIEVLISSSTACS